MFSTTIFKRIITTLILIATFLLTYFLLFANYFQQDEWHGFGIILSQGAGYITIDKSIPELLLGDRVGARILTFGLFNAFALNPAPYGVFALIMQTANILLVFLLTKKLTKQKPIALLASFFFIINELGNEAYSWFGTMTGSLTSVFFFLLSLIFFLKFIDTQKVRFILLSTFLLWFSFLFKEVAGFAFIFYPILYLIYSQKKNNIKTLLISHSPLIILGLIMLIFFAKTVLFIPGDRANYINTGGSLISTLFIHSIQYPLEGIVQVFFPNAFIFKLAGFLTIFINPSLAPNTTEFDVVVQNKNSEITLIVLLILLVSAIVLILKHNWNQISIIYKKALFSSFALLLLSLLPFVVIYRPFSYLDSRHYYLPTVGGSIFLAIFLYIIVNLKNKFYNYVSAAIIIFYFILHVTVLFSDLSLLADRAFERQSFLKQMNQIVPTLPDKAPFFITSDSPGYYGLESLKVPFQSGPGHVMMVNYVIRKQLSPRFFDEDTKNKLYDVGFLYDTLGQGYREKDGKGYGYYYDKLEIEKAINQKLFDKNDIIYLFYNSEIKILERRTFK